MINGNNFESKEAMFYASRAGVVHCGLCPHYCTLAEGQTGRCHTRTNINGKLYTLVYGYPCALNIDPIEKKPLYHFLPASKAFSIATAGCNFTCLNCQNYHISQAGPQTIEYFTLTPQQVIDKCLSAKCTSIAYTYTEPTVFYEYMYDIATLARNNGIKNVMISNGFINPGPLKKLAPLLDAANIDLKTFDDEIYHSLNGGALKPVLNSLKILQEYNVWIEITHLIVPTYTDHTDTLKRMCNWLMNNGFAECPLHFSRFFPTYQLKHLSPTPVPILKQAREIALQAGLKYVYLGNLSENQYSNTYCPGCKQLLVERLGYYIQQVNISEGKCAGCFNPIAGVWT